MLKSYPEFYNKRFKCDVPQQNVSTDESVNELDRSESSSPNLADNSPQSNSTPSGLLQTGVMPLQSIGNKMNSKTAIDFATAYSGIASQSYYSPQNYENYAHFQNHHLNSFQQNQYGAAQPQQPYQFYPGYNATSMQQQQQRHAMTNHRTSLGSSSSADSSSISLNSPPQVDENSSVPRFNAYNSSLGVKPVAPLVQQVNTNETLLRKQNSSANLSFNMGSDDGSMPAKKRRPVPVEHKDNTYWEKRRKNNESAKRSRDVRRSKEEHISIRVIYLEQENLQLRTELALLRSETEKLRAMLYANNQVN